MNNNTQQLQVSINDVFAQTITNVFESFPSIYSKGDVIKVINDLQTSINALIVYDQPNDVNAFEFNIDGFKEEIELIIDESAHDLDTTDFCDPDYESAELSLYDNEISVENIEFTIDQKRLTRALMQSINANLDEAINILINKKDVQSAQ
jgi:hypothetical protein